MRDATAAASQRTALPAHVPCLRHVLPRHELSFVDKGERTGRKGVSYPMRSVGGVLVCLSYAVDEWA